MDARRAFEAGRDAYDEGDFAGALVYYERAYELSSRAQLLFNIGRAAEADNQRERAIEAYEGYLRDLPDASNRGFVEGRLKSLRAAVASTVPLSENDGTKSPVIPQPVGAQLLVTSPTSSYPRYRFVRPVLIASVGIQVSWRNLSYDGGTNLNSFETGANGFFAPSLVVQSYALRHFTRRWISNLGLEFGFNYALGAKSQLEDRSFRITVYDLTAGVILRIPLRYVEPRLRLGYARQVLDARDDPAGLQLPGAAYDAIRHGAELEFHLLERVSFDVGFAWLFVFNAGQLETYNVSMPPRAWEAGGGASFHITPMHGLRLGVDTRRFTWDFKNYDGDGDWLAPSFANDRYIRTTIHYVYALTERP